MGMKRKLINWTGASSASTSGKESQKLNFEDKLANLRKATGRPETVEVPMRCAITGQRAMFVYTRLHAKEKFTLARTIKADKTQRAGGGFFEGLLSRRQSATQYDVDQFDSAGRTCPWCGNTRFVVDCPACHEATCGGTIRFLPNGEEQHHCHPDCGHVALLKTATQISGGKPSRRGLIDDGGHAKPALASPRKRVQALPKSTPPRLAGPKKH
jgi:hypothetical protein